MNCAAFMNFPSSPSESTECPCRCFVFVFFYIMSQKCYILKHLDTLLAFSSIFSHIRGLPDTIPISQCLIYQQAGFISTFVFFKQKSFFFFFIFKNGYANISQQCSFRVWVLVRALYTSCMRGLRGTEWILLLWWRLAECYRWCAWLNLHESLEKGLWITSRFCSTIIVCPVLGSQPPRDGNKRLLVPEGKNRVQPANWMVSRIIFMLSAASLKLLLKHPWVKKSISFRLWRFLSMLFLHLMWKPLMLNYTILY